MSAVLKQKHEIKVYVRMHDGNRQLGNVFLSAGERLQDILNDDRMFLPLQVDEQNSMVMLSKRYIQQIEEVRPEAVKRRYDEVYNHAGQRRPEPEPVQEEIKAPKALNLELDDFRPVPPKKS